MDTAPPFDCLILTVGRVCYGHTYVEILLLEDGKLSMPSFSTASSSCLEGQTNEVGPTSTRFTDPLLRCLHVPIIPTTGLSLCSSQEHFPVFVLYHHPPPPTPPPFPHTHA